ncbi:DUF1318 domain-containing protein, partial [Yersinia enterocolitica]
TLALVEQINIARAEKYQEVAQKNHISTEDVAKLAGQKLVNRAAASLARTLYSSTCLRLVRSSRLGLSAV